MSTLVVPVESAVPLRRPPGSACTILNTSNVDVYFDTEPQRLNTSVPGTVPIGAKLAANGGEHTFENFPCHGVWFRSAIATTIEVQG